MVQDTPGGSFGIQGPLPQDIWRPDVHGSTSTGSLINAPSPSYHQRSHGYPWSVPSDEAILISIGLPATRSHVDVRGLQCYLRPWWCPCLCCCWWPCLGPWFYGSWVRIEAHTPCYPWRPYVYHLCCHVWLCWRPWPMLPPGSILIWLAYIATWGHSDV